ncbi:hypothetical protein CI610_03360 [invertebrate metagenome]|uniref:Uncharacterized protein n=1 Tax=invertebrate metagenome TaxID=1711999 RepID=A0A2H9T3E0_9ZZZZ
MSGYILSVNKFYLCTIIVIGTALHMHLYGCCMKFEIHVFTMSTTQYECNKKWVLKNFKYM